MSNDNAGNAFERLFKLWSAICKMIVDGTRDPNKVAEVLQSIVDEVAEVKIYLRRLLETTLRATDGTETFASCGLFTGGVYGIDVSGVVGNPTPRLKLSVWEMILDGKFSQLFRSLGQVGEYEFEQSQVVAFVRDHSDKLRKDGYATFFHLKGNLVASVRFDDDGQLRVGVRSFSRDAVWYAGYRYRVVSPQDA